MVKIGDIITARAVYTERINDDRYYFEAVNKTDSMEWRLDNTTSGGGIAMDGCSHWIRPLRMWLGEIDEVVAITGNPFENMEGESLVKAIFKFQNNLTATFEAIMTDTYFAPDPYWRIIGSKGELVIEKNWIENIHQRASSWKSLLT